MAWRGSTVNQAPNIVNIVDSSNINVGENRATNTKVGDSTINFSVTLMDIDTTIHKHLDEEINPTIIVSGAVTKVPVFYASPERWIAIQEEGYVRDNNGKIQCPIIAYRRTAMQRNDSLMSLNRHLQYPTIKKFSQKNSYDRFSIMNGFNQIGEVYSVTMPDHIILNYDFIIWTEAVEQGNAVLEKINFATEEYWGSKQGYRFRTTISDYQFQVEVPTEQDRMIKTTFTMMVYAYLLPERFENDRSTIQKSFTTRKIVVTGETVKGISDPFVQRTGLSGPVAPTQKLNGSNVPVIDFPPTPEEDVYQSEWYNKNVLDYQMTYNTKTGSLIEQFPTSSHILFESTSFNTSSADETTYQKLILIIDHQNAPINSFTYYTSGSDLHVVAKNTLLKSIPTTESIITAYGNIR